MIPADKKPIARFEAELHLSFHLPGVRATSSGNMGQNYQLESHGWHENWTLRVAADNALETAAVLRAAADEIERVSKLR